MRRFLICGAALLAAGCASPKAAAPRPPFPPVMNIPFCPPPIPISSPIPPSSWRLELLNGAPATGATLVFGADGSVSGRGPCNGFGGSAAFGPNGAIRLGPLAATMAACADPGLMELEGRYFEALNGAAQYERANGRLILRGASGAEAAAFSPAE